MALSDYVAARPRSRPAGEERRAGMLPEYLYYLLPDAPPPSTQPPTAVEEQMSRVTPQVTPLGQFDRDSQSRGPETTWGGTSMPPGSSLPDPFHGTQPQWANAEPGLMGVLGMSYGTGVDDMGYMHDAGVFDPGALAGGLLGSVLLGPLGGVAGGFGGRQANWHIPVRDAGLMQRWGRDVNAYDVIGNPGQFSWGEVNAAREYVDSMKAAEKSVDAMGPERLGALDAALSAAFASNPAAFGLGGSDSSSRGVEASWGGRGGGYGGSYGPDDRTSVGPGGTLGHI